MDDMSDEQKQKIKDQMAMYAKIMPDEPGLEAPIIDPVDLAVTGPLAARKSVLGMMGSAAKQAAGSTLADRLKAKLAGIDKASYGSPGPQPAGSMEPAPMVQPTMDQMRRMTSKKSQVMDMLNRMKRQGGST